ncbi:MAG: hypothetical protein NVS3B10_26400 [Polyangiales bacterium]
MKTPQQFVQELDIAVAEAVERLGVRSAAGTPAPGIDVAALLVIALRNELEASEEAALWMTGERDVEVKLALARQCGDEAKHYRLIEDRLRALGKDPSAIDPLARGYTPMFEFLRSLTTTVERVAAGPFAREALAQVRNDVFADWCETQGDLETARLYRDVIGPDERHHHALGRKLLLRLATTPQAQDAARAAAMRTLSIAQDLQDAALRDHGVARAPGC